jgi:hypothetical protein
MEQSDRYLASLTDEGRSRLLIEAVTDAGGNTCGPPSERLDLKTPAVLRSDTDHTGHLSQRHRCQWQGRESFRAQAVQGS